MFHFGFFLGLLISFSVHAEEEPRVTVHKCGPVSFADVCPPSVVRAPVVIPAPPCGRQFWRWVSGRWICISDFRDFRGIGLREAMR